MEFIEQWWTSHPWLFSAIVALPIILFMLWKFFWQRRYDDEIYLSDKDLYNRQYFDDSPEYRDDEIVDHSVLEFEKKHQAASKKDKNADEKDENDDELEYSDWQQVRAAETQKANEQLEAIEENHETVHSTQKTTQETADVKTVQKDPQPVKNITKAKELIIAINIRANREAGFKGTDIFAAMEELGIEYGKMSIFHHYGIEKEASQYPIFSIANLVKPGTFNPDERDVFSTPGLIAFLQLPGSLGGRVAFELMLHYTQRLAELLQGRLEDDRKHPVDAALIDFMRKGIDEFEQGRE